MPKRKIEQPEKKRKNSKKEEEEPKKSKRKVEENVPKKRKIIDTRLKKLVDPDVHRVAVTLADNLLRVGTKQYIYKFDPMVLNTERDGKRIGVCGSSGSGKSRLIKEISRFHAKTIPAWMIVNPSEPGNHMYNANVVNESIIHDNDNPKELVKDIYGFKKRQIKRCKDWSIPGTDPIQYTQDPSGGLILDDLSEDPTIFNDPIFGWLWCLSRNFKSWIAILVQHWYLFPKKYRRQFSHVFIFSLSSVKDIKDSYLEVGGVFENFNDYKRAFNLATQEKNGIKGTLVIDVMKSSSKVEDKIFW